MIVEKSITIHSNITLHYTTYTNDPTQRDIARALRALWSQFFLDIYNMTARARKQCALVTVF